MPARHELWSTVDGRETLVAFVFLEDGESLSAAHRAELEKAAPDAIRTAIRAARVVVRPYVNKPPATTTPTPRGNKIAASNKKGETP